jgi:hypothetical protein
MSTFLMTSSLSVGGTVPAGLQATWLAGLTLAGQGKISARWDAVVGTNELWAANVAQRSARAWKKLPNTDFVSRKGLTRDMMVGKQGRKLAAAFQKAKDAHDDVFAGGGTKFIEAITAKQDHYTQQAGDTFTMTGARVTGLRGPVSFHTRAATGDLTFQRDNPPAYSGEPDPEGLDTPEVPYIQAVLKGAFRAAFEGKLIQYGVYLIKGDIPTVDGVNTILDALLTGFVQDPDSVPGTNFIHFANSGGVTLTTSLDNGGVGL